MFGLDWTQGGAVGLLASGVIGLLVSNWGTLAKFTPKIGGTTAVDAGDSDTLDFQAWARLRKRKSLQCPECLEAFKVIGTHFLEG